MRGAGRLCRERPESFLAPREGNALSNFLRNDQMRRGGSRAGPEANALPHCAVESRRAASDKAPARKRRGRISNWRQSCVRGLKPSGRNAPLPWVRRSRKPGPKGDAHTFLTFFCIDSVDTNAHIPVMAKTRLAPSESSRSAAAVVAARASAADAKGSINLRIETGTRQLIDDAAAVLGKTRTEFMVESARRQAVDVLLDQRLFTLDSERYDAFMHALDNPPAPGPKLKALLRRTPAWQK